MNVYVSENEKTKCFTKTCLLVACDSDVYAITLFNAYQLNNEISQSYMYQILYCQSLNLENTILGFLTVNKNDNLHSRVKLLLKV